MKLTTEQIDKYKKYILMVIIVILSLIILGAFSYILFSSKTEAVVEIQDEENLSNIIEESKQINTQDLLMEELEKINKEAEERENINSNINNKKFKKPKYYIKVNYGAQLVDIYTYDENGQYTKCINTFICSTGDETPTSGVYTIPGKLKEWGYMYGDVYGHWVTQIDGNILFHSVPYLQPDSSTLEYEEYDKLGTKASLGCVRLTSKDAKWIYDNIEKGTKVEFYSNLTQLRRKPRALKISNAPESLKCWDPTDSDERNPWKNYKSKKDEK